jgi:hypothetical protein
MSRTNSGKWMLWMFVCAALAAPGVVIAGQRPAGSEMQPTLMGPMSEPALRMGPVPIIEPLLTTPSSACPTSCNSNAQCTTGCGDTALCVGTTIRHCVVL